MKENIRSFKNSCRNSNIMYPKKTGELKQTNWNEIRMVIPDHHNLLLESP